MNERDRRIEENKYAHDIPIVIGSSLRFRIGHVEGRNMGNAEGKAKVTGIAEGLLPNLTRVGVVTIDLISKGNPPVNLTLWGIKTRLDGERWSALLPNKGTLPINQLTGELQGDYEITFYRKKKKKHK